MDFLFFLHIKIEYLLDEKSVPLLKVATVPKDKGGKIFFTVHMIATTTAMSEKVCLLCGSDEVNNSELGELKECGAITVHYYCLVSAASIWNGTLHFHLIFALFTQLLSPALLTNGEENEGILGFMPKDIKLEVGRIKRLV